MTDEELIAMARLAQRDERMSTGALYGDLADRIEALTKERDQHWDSFVHWRKQADDLTGQLAAARQDAKEAEAYAEEVEAKLAKAVEALQWCAMYGDGDVAIATLAEIKGENHE